MNSNGIVVKGLIIPDAILQVTQIALDIENAVMCYDVNLIRDYEKIQPDGTITITIPSEYSDCDVFWVKDDGSKVNMNAEYINGSYVFTTSHFSVYAIVKPNALSVGDVNGDGEVNAKDRMSLTRYLAKWIGYTSIDFTAADVNNDGEVNAKDRMILTRHLAKWQGYETLPLK